MPRPTVVATPGSYRLSAAHSSKKKKKGSTSKGSGTPSSARKGKKGRPGLKKRKGSSRKDNYRLVLVPLCKVSALPTSMYWHQYICTSTYGRYLLYCTILCLFFRSRYTPEDLQNAADLIEKEGWSLAQAAKECNVPRITLHDRMKGTHQSGRVGRPTVLSKVEEEVLVEMLKLLAEFNYPVSKRGLKDLVKVYLDKKRDTIFKHNRPGRKWVKNFLMRHKGQIGIRKATNIRRSRAAVSPDQIREYFSNLKKEIAGLPASHIFNYDETCLRDDPGAEHCIFCKGVHYPEQVKDHSKTSFSVMYCCSASGNVANSYRYLFF